MPSAIVRTRKLAGAAGGRRTRILLMRLARKRLRGSAVLVPA